MVSFIKHYLDDNTVYILEAYSMFSRKRSNGKDYRCLIRLTKHDTKFFNKWQKLLIINQWLDLLKYENISIDWFHNEFNELWRLNEKLNKIKSYWWEWKENKNIFEYIESDSVKLKINGYSGKHDNWRKIQGDEKAKILKRHNILERAYKNLVWIKLTEYEDSND